MAVGGAQNAVQAVNQVVNSPGTIAGSTNASPREKDKTDPATAAQFGEMLQGIQQKFGARAEKPREIKKTLGKDDFLRIMITQMKNQDPTSPFKAEQMASQMAQFTSVEQLKNMNDSLVKMSNANQPMERMAMTGLIGKTLTIDRGRFPHTEGQGDQLSYGLPKDAHEVTVSVISDQGETIFQKELGKMKSGEASFSWDGKKVNSLPAKSGNYLLRIDALDEHGQKIEVNSQAQARVIGVSFEGAEPVLLVGDHQHQEKVAMKSVIRVDADTAGPLNGGGLPPAGSSFFSFEKGVGSKNLDASIAPQETQRALAQYQSHATGQVKVPGEAPRGAPAGAAPAQNEEKGFPNGLHDDPETEQNRRGGGQK